MPLFNPVSQEVSFTPSWTSITLGSSSNVGTYVRVGNLIMFTARIVTSTSFSMGSSPTLNLPVTAAAAPASSQFWINMFDAGTGSHKGYVVPTTPTTTNSGDLAAMNASSTYVSSTNLSATVPFAWGTGGDILEVSGWYIAA